MDAARFLFGTEDPQVIYHPGTITLNAFLDDLENEQAFANMGHTIPEGSRNSTMSRIGARIIKRYGDTPEAKELFLQAAGQCSPPLEERELESIWAGKQRLYAKICNQPGYIPPDAYNSTGPVVWDTPIPFDEYDLPTFPVDALPEVIRRYVLAVAESTQTTVDMAAVEALGVVSLCSQGKYFIRGNADWAEPLNTYTVVILPPAERKSSVLSMMIRPVEVFEKTENERRSPEIVKSQMELSKLEKEKRSLVERASKGKATEEYQEQGQRNSRIRTGETAPTLRGRCDLRKADFRSGREQRLRGGGFRRGRYLRYHQRPVQPQREYRCIPQRPQRRYHPG